MTETPAEKAASMFDLYGRIIGQIVCDEMLLELSFLTKTQENNLRKKHWEKVRLILIQR